MLFRLKLFYLLNLLKNTQCFYVTKSYASRDDLEHSIIQNGFLGFPSNGSFPQVFYLKFNYHGHKIDSTFEKNDNNYDHVIPIYYKDKSGRASKHETCQQKKIVHYKEKDGWGTVSVLRYNLNKFNIIGRIFLKNTTEHIQIFPFKKDTLSRSTNQKNGLFDEHIVIKRSLNLDARKLSENDHLIVSENKIPRSTKIQRSVNGKPLILDVEVLAVLDSSIYDGHKRILETDDDSLIRDAIQTYYAYVFNGVDYKYQRSLSNDKDLRINIKLTNILIQNSEEAKWADTDLNGIPGVESEDGREVLDASKSIEEFSKLNKNFNLNFDHATAIVNKDLKRINPLRDIIGISYQGRVCYDYRSSLVEDDFSFKSIYTIAHEIGHNLDLKHDGDQGALSCNASDGYLMTPSFNFDDMTNAGLFSPCSISALKSSLIDQNGEPSNRAFCLNNSVQVDDSIKEANYSKTGQIWKANDQCKRVFGKSAYFCRTRSAQMCNFLYCKENNTVEVCKSAGPAVEGTACESGKLCTNGFCQTSPLGLEGCIFGDFEVQDNEVEFTLDRLTDTCQNVVKVYERNGKNITDFCNTQTGIIKCCETCQEFYSSNFSSSESSTTTINSNSSDQNSKKNFLLELIFHFIYFCFIVCV